MVVFLATAVHIKVLFYVAIFQRFYGFAFLLVLVDESSTFKEFSNLRTFSSFDIMYPSRFLLEIHHKGFVHKIP